MVADGYKDTEIGIIPIEWEVEKIDNLLEKFQNGYAFSSKGYIEKGVPIVSMASISLDGKFQFNYDKAKYWDSEKLNELEAYVLNKNDLIIAMTDVTPDKKLIGRMAIVDIDDTFLLNQRVGLLKLKSNINHIFLSNYSNHTQWRSYSKNISALGAQANLSTKDIKEAKIPLPPLNEQEKIADILTTADDKIDAIAIQIEKAETLKKGLLQKLLSEGIGHSEFKDSELGKIPESWEVVKLDKLIEDKYITSHLDGNHGGLYPKQSEFVESGTPYLSANMIKGNNIDFSLAKFLTKERASMFRKGVAKDKDVLFAHNATVGPVTLLKTNLDYVILSTTLTYYRCDLEKLNNYYLMNYMKSIYFINQYEKFMKQSTRNQIPITQQRQLYFIIPPLEEQKKIANILSTADEKLEVLRAKKGKYETLKKGLLQKLLSGEVRVAV